MAAGISGDTPNLIAAGVLAAFAAILVLALYPFSLGLAGVFLPQLQCLEHTSETQILQKWGGRP